MDFQKALQPLLQNEVFIFSSEHGKKGVTDTNLIRLKNQITKADDVKVKSNYNIMTGRGDIADVDLDSDETRLLSPRGVLNLSLEITDVDPDNHREPDWLRVHRKMKPSVLEILIPSSST